MNLFIVYMRLTKDKTSQLILDVDSTLSHSSVKYDAKVTVLTYIMTSDCDTDIRVLKEFHSQTDGL